MEDIEKPKVYGAYPLQRDNGRWALMSRRVPGYFIKNITDEPILGKTVNLYPFASSCIYFESEADAQAYIEQEDL